MYTKGQKVFYVNLSEDTIEESMVFSYKQDTDEYEIKDKDWFDFPFGGQLLPSCLVNTDRSSLLQSLIDWKENESKRLNMDERWIRDLFFCWVFDGGEYPRGLSYQMAMQKVIYDKTGINVALVEDQ